MSELVSRLRRSSLEAELRLLPAETSRMEDAGCVVGGVSKLAASGRLLAMVWEEGVCVVFVNVPVDGRRRRYGVRGWRVVTYPRGTERRAMTTTRKPREESSLLTRCDAAQHVRELGQVGTHNDQNRRRDETPEMMPQAPCRKKRCRNAGN